MTKIECRVAIDGLLSEFGEDSSNQSRLVSSSGQIVAHQLPGMKRSENTNGKKNYRSHDRQMARPDARLTPTHLIVRVPEGPADDAVRR